jgi:hypothetical protein
MIKINGPKPQALSWTLATDDDEGDDEGEREGNPHWPDHNSGS